MNIPLVHLNGTSRSSLIAQRMGVYKALHAAIEALADACPNMRDYYPRPGTWEPARDEHAARMQTLWAMYAEIVAEIIALQEEEA